MTSNAAQCPSASKSKAAQDHEDTAVRETLDRIRHKFLVMSGKGGVGKTSVSVNLAMALAERGHRVGLMDIDIHGPDIPRMLGLNGNLEGSGSKLKPLAYSPGLCAVSVESLLPNRDDAVIWRGPLKHSFIRQFIGDVEWGPLDYLVIDSPPGTGDEPLTIAQSIPDARAIIVTTPQEVSLGDVRKSISFCKTVKMEIFGIIENMSGFVCPHCKQPVQLFGSGGGRELAASSGIRFLGHIPFDMNIVSCGDQGASFLKNFKNSQAAKAFDSIASAICQ